MGRLPLTPDCTSATLYVECPLRRATSSNSRTSLVHVETLIPAVLVTFIGVPRRNTSRICQEAISALNVRVTLEGADPEGANVSGMASSSAVLQYPIKQDPDNAVPRSAGLGLNTRTRERGSFTRSAGRRAHRKSLKWRRRSVT